MNERARAKVRVLTVKAAWLRIGNDAPEPAKLLDISESGARIELSTDHKNLAALTLVWEPVPGVKALVLKARLTWKKRRLVGLSFGETDARTKYFLRSLVRYHRAE